jgi:hypothetical protein
MCRPTKRRLRLINAVRQRKQWRKHAQSEEWVGVPVANALGLDPTCKVDRKRLKATIELWLSEGTLIEKEGRDAKRRPNASSCVIHMRHSLRYVSDR